MLEKSLLLTCKFLGLLVNTLAGDKGYPVLNRDNLTIPIQMQVSGKEKTFSHFLAAFLKSTWNFRYFEEEDDPHRLCIFKITELENVVREMPKNFRFRGPFEKHHGKRAQPFWNLHQSTFTIFTDPCQVNWVGKSLSDWHAKSWDCLSTHSLKMKCILFLKDTI